MWAGEWTRPTQKRRHSVRDKNEREALLPRDFSAPQRPCPNINSARADTAGPIRPAAGNQATSPAGAASSPSSHALILPLGSAPTLVAAGAPFLNRIIVGMPRTP